MQITIANRGNSVYKVSGRMSLLQELREQGVDYLMVVNTEDVLRAQLN